MGILYLVGTPIGNLGDFSPRAVEILNEVDFIAAEDTRVTLKLLNHFDIKKPMISYFEHNIREKGEVICERLEAGENCAIVTDAGMPAISDPGQDLVKICRERGIEVHSVPGPTAAMTALALSGLPTGRFCFEGFLSVNKKARKDHLLSVKDEERTMVFYEAPHKLMRTLEDFKDTFGEDRQIALCREMTKIYEEVLVMTIKEAIAHFEEKAPKGEFVIIVHGKEEGEKEEYTVESAVELAKSLMEEGLSPAQAAKEASKISSVKKSDIYKELVI